MLHFLYPHGYLADEVISEEDVPGSEVTVDKLFSSQVLHTQGYLRGEVEQLLGKVSW